jgi:hypothetical protein
LWKRYSPKSNEAAGHRLAVDPRRASPSRCQPRGRTQQHGDLVGEVVLLAVGTRELDRAAHRVLEVDLADHHVRPRRRRRVLAVGHEDLGARVEGVDHHLAVDRAGDLDAAVGEVGGHRRHLPVAGADVFGLGEEVGEFAGVEAGLALLAGGQQLATAAVEAAMQVGDEGEGLRGEDLVEAVLRVAADLDAVAHGSRPPVSSATVEIRRILHIGQIHAR